MNVLYLCVHSRLKQNCDLDGIIPRSKLFIVLGETYHIPKKHLYSVLREMVFLDLVECPSPNEIKVLDAPIDVDNVSKIQEQLGFY